MRFKALATALVALTLSACSLRLGEQTQMDGALELGSQTACLSGATKTIVEYFDGRATDERIAKVWDCASSSLKLFAERTRGKTVGLYSPRELRNFLEYYFLNKDGRKKETVITDRMLGELMELKRTLLGGSLDALTQEELAQARAIMEIIRDQSIRLRPYLPLSVARYQGADESELNAAVNAMEEAVSAFARVLRGTGHDYLFSHLSVFLQEMEIAAGKTESAEAIRVFRGYLPLIQQLKGSLIAPDSSKIASDEWELLLKNAVRWYGLLLRFANARHQHSSWVHLTGREKLVSIAGSAYALLDESLARRADGTIDFSEFDALINAIDPALFTVQTYKGPRQIQREHVRDLVRVIVKRALAGPNAGPEGRDATGLTRAALKRAMERLIEWSEGQRYIDLLWAKAVGTLGSGDSALRASNVTGKAYRSTLVQFSVEEVFGLPRDQIPEAAWTAASRLRDLIGRREPLFRGDDSELSFTGASLDPEFSYGALTRMNFFSLMGRLLLASYAQDLKRAETGVTQAEVERFYLDFRDIGVDLKLFDPAATNVVAKRFLEADLFTFDSNGDDLMSADEASGILAFLTSIKALSIRAHDGIAAVCNRAEHESGTPVPVDFFDYELVPADCYRREFFERFDSLMERMPKLGAYYDSLSGSRRAEFEEQFLAAAGLVPGVALGAQGSENLAGIAHYVESMFQRFDRDQSGTIGKKEAIRSRDSVLNVFGTALKAATCKAGSCLTETSDLEAVLTYLLAHGKTPSKMQYVFWKLKRPFWSFEADRTRVLEILGNLARVLNGQPTAKLEPESRAFPGLFR